MIQEVCQKCIEATPLISRNWGIVIVIFVGLVIAFSDWDCYWGANGD